jgi:hypothetical protein
MTLTDFVSSAMSFHSFLAKLLVLLVIASPVFFNPLLDIQIADLNFSIIESHNSLFKFVRYFLLHKLWAAI